MFAQGSYDFNHKHLLSSDYALTPRRRKRVYSEYLHISGDILTACKSLKNFNSFITAIYYIIYIKFAI